jgi:ribosomal protein L44E
MSNICIIGKNFSEKNVENLKKGKKRIVGWLFRRKILSREGVEGEGAP